MVASDPYRGIIRTVAPDVVAAPVSVSPSAEQTKIWTFALVIASGIVKLALKREAMV